MEAGQDLLNARHFYRYLGGNASNVAIGLARLGLDAAIVSKVGRDIHGDYLLACLERERVDSRWVTIDAQAPTAQCYMTESIDGVPDYYAWPSVNASKSMLPEELTDEFFSSSWIVHMAAVSFIAKPRRSAMTHAVQRAQKEGVIISFDAGFPRVESSGGKQAAWQAMSHADIIKFNRLELEYWSGLPASAGLEQMVSSLQSKLNPALLVVTLAEQGAVLYHKDQSAFCPPFKVQSVGDVGPGDAFSAGLIYGLSTLGSKGMEPGSIRQLDISDWLGIAPFACCAGALVTRARSATERFPDIEELHEACHEYMDKAVSQPWENSHPLRNI